MDFRELFLINPREFAAKDSKRIVSVLLPPIKCGRAVNFSKYKSNFIEMVRAILTKLTYAVYAPAGSPLVGDNNLTLRYDLQNTAVTHGTL
jgi:hypothetical protein